MSGEADPVSLISHPGWICTLISKIGIKSDLSARLIQFGSDPDDKIVIYDSFSR